jgi:hypothetical protein
MWKPWDGGIYLMAPTKDVQQGEYGLVDTEYLEQLPQLEYFPQRIAKDSVTHIARGCLLFTGQLEALFNMCTGPYDFILITNEPDGRARVRLNGVTPVAGINYNFLSLVRNRHLSAKHDDTFQSPADP